MSDIISNSYSLFDSYILIPMRCRPLISPHSAQESDT